jgi:integrase
MRIPGYLRHKASGQGYARIRGRCVYFGPYDRPESLERYKAVIAELMATPADQPVHIAPRTTTVADGVQGYLDAMRSEWGDGAKGDRHLVRLRHALGVVLDLFGKTNLSRFGVSQLEAVRAEMVRRDWSRRHVNEQVCVIRRCWRWLTLRGHVPPGTSERMQALEGLKEGRCPAREAERSEPPTPETLARVLARLDRTNPVVAAMVRVQLASGARTGELLALSTDRIDASGPVWIYRPLSHKNAHRGHKRAIVLPPEAVAALRPLVGETLVSSADPVFSPRRAVELRPRTTAHPPGWRAGRRTSRANTNPRPPRNHYTSFSYAQAIRRTCAAEGVPAFRPYDLRHLAITRWAETLGVEAARVLAGHQTLRMTSHYVHTDASRIAALLLPKAG